MPRSKRTRPLVYAAILVVGAGTAAALDARRNADPSDEGTAGLSETTTARSTPAAGPERIAAAGFCTDAGYLCAGLQDAEEITLRRWVGHEGTVVVHVPLPEAADVTKARALQRAAATGVRAWNNQPYPILIDLRGDRNPHFAVDWRESLGGSQLGVTRTSWSPSTGLQVVALSLSTRHPFDRGATVDERQVRLTAAHEMGHALGLPHSDQERDVMYPTNTATSMSARDYRSIEVLYATPDGTVVTR